MKIRVWKSLTFVVGLVLFIAGFGIVLFAGTIFNPPPYRIVIAVQDIEPYTTLTQAMLATDEQTMHQKVASRLVHESEVEMYLGGMVVETIHAGEPLRRNAVVSPDNPAAVHRLSLALDDPNLVAAVVPVDPKTIPDNVTAGDYVNITMGVEGSISSQAAGWGLTGPEVFPPLPPALLPEAISGTLPISVVESLPFNAGDLGEEGEEEVLPEGIAELLEDVLPPLDKIVLPHVQIIDVARERMANPNYGMGMGNGGESEPAFLEGDIESITVLVPASAEELLYFAVDNGTLHASVVPHAAVMAGTGPSTGVMWDDIVEFFKQDRLRALGLITETATMTETAAIPLAPTGELTGTGSVTETSETSGEGSMPTPTPAGSSAQPTATPAAAAASGGETTADTSSSEAPPSEPSGGESGGLFGGLSGIVVYLFIGAGLVLLVGAVVMIAQRRKKG